MGSKSLEPMYSRRLMGLLALIASIVFLIVYSWLLLVSDYSIIIIKYTVLAFVTGLVALLAWLGLTLATTKPKE